MRTIRIANFGIETTAIGFGCSSLLGLLSARESSRLIDAAFDAGVRHFDVAPAYGYGEAEALLGRTLGARCQYVTITTKFGLPVPANRSAARVVRNLARPLLKRFASLRRSSKAAAAAFAVTVPFTREEARRSLERSLRDLRIDRVDLFLLHEARTELLRDPGLMDFLREAQQKGQIRGFGIGSTLPAIPEMVEQFPGYCPLVQHEWNVLTGDVALPDTTFRVCHGALLRALPALQSRIEADGDFARTIGIAAQDLPAILLRSGVRQYPEALTLFSARTPGRIHANIEALENASLDPACARLRAALTTPELRI